MSTSSPLIISHPENQDPTQRAFFRLLTVAIWMLWCYLWLPLITAFLWMLGIHTAYLLVFRGARGIGLQSVAWIILACISLVLYWSTYNKLRYAKHIRRNRLRVVSKAEVGEEFGILDPEILVRLTKQRCLSLHFDDCGTLLAVEDLKAPSPD